MIPAIRAELRKFFTTRMWWGMGLGCLAAGAAFSALIALAATSSPSNGSDGPGYETAGGLVSIYTAGLGLGYVLTLTVGVLVICSELRHKTITGTYLATPSRPMIVASKAVAMTVVAVFYGLLVLIGGVGAGAAVMLSKGHAAFIDTPTMLRSLALCLLVLVAWGIIGLGIGVLVRNQIAGILIGVGVGWIVEPIVSMLLAVWEPGKPVAKFLPSMATEAVKGGGGPMPPGVDILQWWQGALVLLAYALVATLVGLLLFSRRDIV